MTEEHRAAAANERARSQSRTKFFTPVTKAPADSKTPTEQHAPAGSEQPTQPRQQQRPATQQQQQQQRVRHDRPRRMPGFRRTKQSTDTGFRPAAPISENATYGPELPGESQVQLVLDLALRIGEVKMACGAGAADTTEAIYAVTEAYGLPHCEVDVIFSSITVSVHRGSDVNPITAVRLVRSRGSDYTRLEATDNLLQRISAGNGKFRPYEASTELEQITKARHPYPRWVATTAWAGMAASVAVLIHGGPMVALVTAVISAVIDRVGRFLNKRALPTFFQQLLGGMLATFIALVIVAYGGSLFSGPEDSSLVIGAAITVLLSGLSVVQTVQDAVTGYYVTAAGRTIEIALVSAGLIGGVVIAIRIAATIGLTSTDFGPPQTPSVDQVPLLMAAGAAAATFFALASYAKARTLLVSAAAGALGGACYGAVLATASSPIMASGAAAILIGFVGGLLTRRLRIPPVIVAVAGLTPLLPGYSTYRALYGLATSKHIEGISTGAGNLVVAITIALALGAGVVFGQFLAHPVRKRLGRWQRQFLTQPFAGRRGQGR